MQQKKDRPDNYQDDPFFYDSDEIDYNFSLILAALPCFPFK
jgi:hypothetical protein